MGARQQRETSFGFGLHLLVWAIVVVFEIHRIEVLAFSVPKTCQHYFQASSPLTSTRMVSLEQAPNESTQEIDIGAEGGKEEEVDTEPTSNSAKDNNHQRRKKKERPKKKKGSAFEPKMERPRIPILQYHSDWVCVNKPAQMSVHRSGGQRQRAFVVSTLLKRQLARKVWPVHRLDHRTSGALLFAFDSQTCGQLHACLTDKEQAHKEYIALVRGDWRGLPETVLVDRPVTVAEGVQKDAQTEFTCLASIETGDAYGDEYQGACSLVKCRLLTGRKHQIRRHAYAIGRPILGDSEHGDSKVNRWWRQNRDMKRLFLHCLSLDLPPLPRSEDDEDEDEEKPRIQCVAPLPEELSSVLRRPDMQALWRVAIEKDPRLAMEPYDQKGGTLGRRFKKREELLSQDEQ